MVATLHFVFRSPTCHSSPPGPWTEFVMREVLGLGVGVGVMIGCWNEEIVLAGLLCRK